MDIESFARVASARTAEMNTLSDLGDVAATEAAAEAFLAVCAGYLADHASDAVGRAYLDHARFLAASYVAHARQDGSGPAASLLVAQSNDRLLAECRRRSATDAKFARGFEKGRSAVRREWAKLADKKGRA